MKEQTGRGGYAERPSSSAAVDPADAAWSGGGADIPRLREKENERKGAGVPWYAGSGGGPSQAVLGSGGIRVGAGMLRPGFLGSARVAAAIARALGGPGTILGGFFASQLGSMAVLAAMAAWGVLIIAAGAKLLGGASPSADSLPAALPAMGSSGIVINAPKDNSLGYLATANQGELQWDKESKPKEGAVDGRKADVPAAPEADKLPEAPKTPDLSQLMGAAAQKPGALDRNGFMAKLTNDPSSLRGGLGGMRDSLNAMKPIKTFAGAGLPKPVQLGRTAAMRRAMQALSGHKSALTASSQRAMGQLKFAKGMSASAGNAKLDSQARQYSTDAFEQGKTSGGLGGVGDGGGVVVPPGDGAPGVTDVSPPEGANVTPYQPQVDAARNLDDNAAKNKNMGDMLTALGAILLALGMALMAVGMKLVSNPMTAPIGAMLLAIGAMLLAAGIALMAAGSAMKDKAKDQADQAKNKGQQIQQQYGQPDQNAVIGDCSSLAADAGIGTGACSSAASAPAAAKAAANTVHDAVQQESNATYQLNGGNGQEARAARR